MESVELRVAAPDFAVWMREEHKRVFLLCLRMLRSHDEAENATQDVFWLAYKALTGPRGAQIEDPARWLTRITVNVCLKRLRSARWKIWRRRPSQEDEQVILALAPAVGPDSEALIFAQQIGRRLARALDGLSARQRTAFVLRHYEDRGLEEIAAVLEVDVGTARTHLNRALAKLRSELEDLYYGKALER